MIGLANKLAITLDREMEEKDIAVAIDHGRFYGTDETNTVCTHVSRGWCVCDAEEAVIEVLQHIDLQEET
jgi:hypothetical protein